MPRIPRPARSVVLGLTLAALLGHAAAYAFLCDDAFISFRYAVHLAEGQGLVFNAGFERVEGYTNFLWVLLLAAGRAAGVRPEVASLALSLAATIGLWALVAAWSWRSRNVDTPEAWIAVWPPLFLALSRSVAVWSTGGLETRLFEGLVVAGTLKGLLDLERDRAGLPARAPWSGLLLGLAALTRPDGVLIGVSVLAGCAACAWRDGAWSRRAWIARTAAFAIPVAAHLAFRIVYYGAWVPNTYAAKIGGKTWWEAGVAYVGAFTLEYAAFLWIPLVGLAVAAHRRERTLAVPAVFAAAVVPHALYVVAIGGDHFEYRPLGLIFPFAALLTGDGLAVLVRRGRPRLAAAAACAVLAGLVWLPTRSHLEFPRDRYRSAFPGASFEDGAAERFLDPFSDPLLSLPVLRRWPEAHRALLRASTARMIGIRQEEHALFLESIRPQGTRLAQLIAGGEVPSDLFVALSCVGAVPYDSGLRTLDRLGLTDAVVARMAARLTRRSMGHDVRDTAGYEREVGVDLSALRAARVLFDGDDPDLLPAVTRVVQAGGSLAAVRVGGDAWLVGTPAQGFGALRAKFPGAQAFDFADPAALDAFADLAIASLRSDDPATTLARAQALLLRGRYAEARPLFERVVLAVPDQMTPWRGLAGARAATGDLDGARAAVARGSELAHRRGAEEAEAAFGKLADRLASPAPQAPPSIR